MKMIAAALLSMVFLSTPVTSLEEEELYSEEDFYSQQSTMLETSAGSQQEENTSEGLGDWVQRKIDGAMFYVAFSPYYLFMWATGQDDIDHF